MERKKYNGLQKAVVKAGGIPKIANLLGVTHKTISGWLRDDGVDAPEITDLEGSGIAKAIVAAGGVSKMAAALGVHHQAVNEWKRQGYAPVGRAQEIELQFGVPRIDLVSAKVRNAMGAGGEL